MNNDQKNDPWKEQREKAFQESIEAFSDKLNYVNEYLPSNLYDILLEIIMADVKRNNLKVRMDDKTGKLVSVFTQEERPVALNLEEYLDTIGTKTTLTSDEEKTIANIKAKLIDLS